MADQFRSDRVIPQKMDSKPLTLLVYSHVRWDVEFQRPQQLMSRVARRHRVIYIEEPVVSSEPARLERLHVGDGVLVLRPHCAEAAFDAPAAVETLAPLLRQVVRDEAHGDIVTWLCTPMALPLAESVPARLLVYDCVGPGESTAATHEAAVLDTADLVLAAGPGLWRAKRALHPNVHCVPSSSDAARFAPARVTAHCQEYMAAERLQSHILAPRLGFIGAIDDCVDLRLVDAIAARRPDWHVVMVGPVVTVKELPQRSNLHWLGDQPDARLPAIVAAWDVCLLPYISDRSTQYLCPAQALEYLAAEKPVISTALPDVCAMYQSAVRTARGTSRFIEACAAALRETPAQRAARMELAAACVTRFSWDEAVRNVLRLLDVALEPHEAVPLLSAMPDMALPAAAAGA
jgi:UDP-galactopyranose mutase